jgi:predicted ABC-type ATPase
MITVIAGVNGAGKSSIAGANLRSNGGDYFNPDEVARDLIANTPSMSQQEANGKAWKIGYEQLLRAIEEGHDYAFETTLGGNSICQALHDAVDRGQHIRILYSGLASLELHIQRVKERVSRGGHDIPEAKICDRYKTSTFNMIDLIPICHTVRVFDNSESVYEGKPSPVCLFSLSNGRFTDGPVEDMPDWAMPLAGIAMKIVGSDDSSVVLHTN